MKHTSPHKYELIYLGTKLDYPVYRCALPDCTHYIQQKLGRGKSSRCWKCEETFVLTARNRNIKRPKCEDCRAGKVKVKVLQAEAESEKPVPMNKTAADDLIGLLISDRE